MTRAEKNPHLVAFGSSSAGGIEAFSQPVSTPPEGLPSPVVIAQHLEPGRRNRLQEIFAREDRSPVRTFTDHETALRADGEGRPKPSVGLFVGSAAGVLGEGQIAVSPGGTGSVEVEAGSRRTGTRAAGCS